jgi:hypothetical protein
MNSGRSDTKHSLNQSIDEEQYEEQKHQDEFSSDRVYNEHKESAR